MIFNREPALIIGFVEAIIALALGFGVDLNGEQVAGIMAGVAAFLSLIIRQKVTPVDNG